MFYKYTKNAELVVYLDDQLLILLWSKFDCERLLFYCINIMLLRNFYFEIKISFILLDDTTGTEINFLELSWQYQIFNFQQTCLNIQGVWERSKPGPIS